MTPANFHRDAEEELIEAASYYERQREGLGQEFLDEITRSLEFAGRFPQAVPKVRGSVRSLVLSRFPYSILYRVLKGHRLRVLAVAHHKRKPGYWHKRK